MYVSIVFNWSMFTNTKTAKLLFFLFFFVNSNSKMNIQEFELDHREHKSLFVTKLM